MGYIRISCFLIFSFVCLTNCQIPGGLLGGGDGDKKAKDSFGVVTDRSLGKFTCPGTGNYAVKKHGGDRCSKFYICGSVNDVPFKINKCLDGKKFNRLSRSCVRRKYAECKWCTVEGRHADLTSKSHFLECVAGSIALRYRCREGKYNATRRSCTETAWEVMDVTIDAELDTPEDIEEFQKTWNEKKKRGRQSTIDEDYEKTTTGKGKGDGDDEDEGGDGGDDEDGESDSESKTKNKSNKAKGSKKDQAPGQAKEGGLVRLVQ